MIDLTELSTEARNPETSRLDEMSPLEIAQAMNREDARAVAAVTEVLPQVAQAIAWTAAALGAGGRIIYMGAGTSGRLGVLDAAECPPTFGVSPNLVVGLIAGGEQAIRVAIEGAEDSPTLGEEDLKALGLTADDVVIGLAASGRTPYVVHGLRYARTQGCKTVAIACNRGSAIGAEAALAIEPVPGPEVLTGSTRLKAGTVQKLVLNMISTATMVGLGKVYGNLMVDVQQTNEKLVTRAQNIVMEATGASRDEAVRALAEAAGSVKVAVVMVLGQMGADAARTALASADGQVRRALDMTNRG
ncbi:N-acetylmuramic acid 6-phosphate etherase [Collinsella vaginalis]|uniref:N-acetylmuramic acid 6-phosphate etherase n=1 Tax=Collinsella vaginalis TaxID=1870987 RepID=UPI000A272519|nr:N-acetylmuramic acid 6-phosphate etherase [Collinsella vaginalis]